MNKKEASALGDAAAGHREGSYKNGVINDDRMILFEWDEAKAKTNDYRPVKKQITLRLDADVIAWLRVEGQGYQTKANALLRNAMVKDVTAKAS